MVHTLCDLRDLLQQKKIRIVSFNGWQLSDPENNWTMAHDVLYRNGEPFSKKDLAALKKQTPKQPLFIKKMINSGKFIENGEDENE